MQLAMNRAVIIVAIGLGLIFSHQVKATAEFYVDSPRVNTWQEPEIEVGGWIWGGVDDPVVRVVLESGAWSHPLDFGLERDDVATYLGEPGANLSGFHSRLELPVSMGSDQSLQLVAYRQSGERIEVKAIRYRPVTLSTLWQPWLKQYLEWREDPFWFALGTSGISARGDQGFSDAYANYQSDTFRIGLRVPILYMRSTRGRAEDWQFDPDLGRVPLDSGLLLVDDWLEGLIELSVDKSLPMLFTLNGGVWGDANGGLPDYDLTDYLELDPRNCQWDQHDKVYPDDLVSGLPGSLKSPELSRVLTLNAYNDTVRMYKKRNLQDAGRRLAAFATKYPSLFSGINLDADVYLSPFVKGSWHDFNPDTLRQFRDWLGGNGLYGDGAILASYREQALTLAEVSEIAQKSFSEWGEVTPPRDMPRQFLPGESEPWPHLWERFRRHLVDLHYDDLSRWLVEVGIDPDKIYSSQGFMAPRNAAMPFSERLDSSLKNYDSAGMTVEGARPNPGHLGAIIYGQSAMNNIETESGRSLFRVFYDMDPDWGIVEHNTADFRDPPGQLPGYGEAYTSLRELFNFHARVLSPMAWNGSNGEFVGEPGFHAHTAYLNTPLDDAVRDFLSEYAFLPRNALYWPFGNEHHISADGWYKTDNQTLLWADKGVLRWRHPEAQLRLISPPGLAIEAAVHTTLVLGIKGGGQLRSIGVEFIDSNKRERGWQVVTEPVPVAGLERSDAGWVVPLLWSADAQPEQIRLVLETGSQGEMIIEQIAILPTGAP
jgi:hypothetical protein